MSMGKWGFCAWIRGSHGSDMTGTRFPPALFLPEGPDWAQWAGGRGQVSTGHLPHARPFSRLLNPLSGRGGEEEAGLGESRS